MTALVRLVLAFCLFSSLPVLLRAQAVGVAPSNTKLPSSEGKTSVPVPDEVTLIEEKSLEFDATLGAPPDPGGDPSNGVRFYSFVLKPKEKFEARLKAEVSNFVGMKALRPVKDDKMVTQFFRHDRMPRTLQSSRFDITNVTSEPYTLVLMVYGRINTWYKVEIHRSI